ncbi:glycosyltransferase family 2 protein [uncultured Algimonas sp.]|uniref:glycosyltransferase family 2 protein n=1 Tax=uncultured Algimonas sp. TaxID=1547920 RepID=UPI0026262B07|nr:glycosyltransferase family 2 protein [uncultured Algimonas sp.]
MTQTSSLRQSLRVAPLPERRSGTLGLIVPVYDEAEAVGPFLEAVRPFLDGVADCEILFVNDGSRDGTLDRLCDAALEDRRIAVLNLARNFGKEAAMSAGLDHCDADAVIIMDVDGQDPPELIPEFLHLWRSGYDVVVGERVVRRSDSWMKRMTARLFYNVFNRLSSIKIPPNVGDFRLIDRRVVLAIRRLEERNRFMKGLYTWVGFPTASLPYERPARQAGRTKFKWRQLTRFALDGIFGFSTVPLKLSTYLSGLLAAGALIYAAYLIVRTLVFGVDLPGYASLMVVVLCAAAAQFFVLGLIGEYVSRLTIETKRRPVYILEGEYRRTDDP